MADYKELLRRAVSALPENNGAARRAVYEKARSALVGQLRAINPPLPARDITQHRLQLEDCIRQVEQEASEAVISFGREGAAPPRPTPAAAPAEKPADEPRVVEPAKPLDAPKPAVTAPVPTPIKPAEAPKSTAPIKVSDSVKAPAAVIAPVTSIEDIIAEAAATTGASVVPLPKKPEEAAVAKPAAPVAKPAAPVAPPIISKREPEKNNEPAPQPVVSSSSRSAPSPQVRDEVAPVVATPNVDSTVRATQPEPSVRSLAPQSAVLPVEAALSSVREVDVEAARPNMSDAEGAIERAIETLDREARGEASPIATAESSVASSDGFSVVRDDDRDSDAADLAAAPPASRSGAGMTIFLVVFVVLLAGVGGAGFWAWREGFVDLDQMFGRSQQTIIDTTPTAETTTPTLDPVQSIETQPANEASTGPGNTATTAAVEPTVSLEGVEIEDRLEPTPEAVVPTGGETTLPGIGTGEVKGEERLAGDDPAATAADELAASVDPAVLAGSQSLLLEASQDGRTGAVPFSGTVDWNQGEDELGLPTLIGKANIPARNLGVTITIRKNSDPSLPASHLMEVDFAVSDTFIGGAISNLPGVLLKDQELVPGTPLIGASARVVGNSFLFALSASEADAATNLNLLENRRWMDLAVVYGTGRNAILTLEKDDAAQTLFETVFASWAQ